MVNHLYKNFLSDEKVYKQNIEFWKSMIFTLLSVEKLTFGEYLTSNKPDGTLYMDGNPIFNFKPDNTERAVRIIQEAPESENIEFSAWINSTGLSEDSKIEELVISLELSNETLLLSIELINAWIVTKLPRPSMEKYIDKLYTIKENLFAFENQLNKL